MSSVINVRLNEKMTLRFVELYRDQRLLWDKEHEAYNKRTDRLRAYRHIADGMAVDGLGVPEVASKIKNIRSTYLQELKKIKDSAHRHLVMSEEDGDAAAPYVPKLAWFPIIDSMIGGAAVKRLYSSPSTAEMLSIDYAEDEESYSGYTYADNGGGGGDTTISIGKRHNAQHQSHHLHEPPPDDSPPPPPKRYMYEKQQSSIELFSKYIATSLEALPPKLAVEAQKDLHDVLVKYKLKEFEDQ